MFLFSIIILQEAESNILRVFYESNFFYFVTIDLPLVITIKIYVPFYCPFGNSLFVAAPEKGTREGRRSC